MAGEQRDATSRDGPHDATSNDHPHGNAGTAPAATAYGVPVYAPPDTAPATTTMGD